MNDIVKPTASSPDEAIALARRDDFSLGNTTLRPSLRTIVGPLGMAMGEPRVVRVLIALADRRGAVLSREDLLRSCWDGRVVGDDAINRAVAEVRRIAAEVGADFEVETVRRIGYRIAGIDWDGSVQPNESFSGGLKIGRRTLIAGSAAAVAVMAGGVAALVHRSREAQIDELVERGRVLQGSGTPEGFKKAEALFREAIDRNPERADAWGWLANVLDDNTLAREAAQRALALDPKEPNARTVIAFQRRDLDGWTQWEDALLAILADAPDTVMALDHLTLFYQGMGRCKDSWQTNERAIRSEPFNPSHFQRRALKHWIFGRASEADKVADNSLELWPRNPLVWNARMILFAFTDRAEAALALLDDTNSRPADMTPQNVASWRAALKAIASRSPADVRDALKTCTAAAPLAPGLAANAIMFFSYLGELDAAYRVAQGLFKKQGPVIQRGHGIRDFYSGSSWGRSQFLFIPATAGFRADSRFPDFCVQTGHVAYWSKRGIWPDPFVRGALDPDKLA